MLILTGNEGETPVVSLADAAKILGTSTYFVKKMLASGKLSLEVFEGKDHVLLESVQLYLDREEQKAIKLSQLGILKKDLYDTSLRYIYGLHSGDERYRFIGQTNDPARRILLHQSSSRCKGRTAKEDWMRSVGDQNVQLSVLASFGGMDREAMQRVEAEYIQFYKIRGYDLLNTMYEWNTL